MAVPPAGAVEKAERGGAAGLAAGVVSASVARQLIRLPVNNQVAVLQLENQKGVAIGEVRGVIDLLATA